MEFKLIKVNNIANNIVSVKICREDKANALNHELINELELAFSELSKVYKVIILHGSEKFFSAGVDVHLIEKATYEDALLGNFINEKWTALEKVDIPVIAVVDGIAFGGGFELALMCDIIISSDVAKFYFPEINLGLIPGLGGTRKLFELVGAQKAFEIISTGRVVKASEAIELGIVSYIEKDPFGKALEIASSISDKPDISIRSVKKMFSFIKNKKFLEDITFERQLFNALLSSKIKKIKVKEFLNR